MLHGLVLGLDGAGRDPGHEDAADGHDEGGGEHGHVYWDTDAAHHTAHQFYPESGQAPVYPAPPHSLHMRTQSYDPSLHPAAAADRTTWFFRRIMDNGIIVITYSVRTSVFFHFFAIVSADLCKLR